MFYWHYVSFNSLWSVWVTLTSPTVLFSSDSLSRQVIEHFIKHQHFGQSGEDPITSSICFYHKENAIKACWIEGQMTQSIYYIHWHLSIEFGSILVQSVSQDDGLFPHCLGMTQTKYFVLETATDRTKYTNKAASSIFYSPALSAFLYASNSVRWQRLILRANEILDIYWEPLRETRE